MTEAKKRALCVFTSTRAEYGLLSCLMREIADDPDLQLQLIVSGTHLSPRHGLTVRQIETDGFTIDARVDILSDSDEPLDIARAMGRCTIGVAEALDRLSPSIFIILGDRYEALAAAQAAAALRIPIAHIHGGETTEGAFDDCFRHAITKLSQWHFVAAEPYRQRVIQMGEAPDRVFNFGAPGLDIFEKLEWMDRPELEKELGLKLGSPLFLVTYHPVTLAEDPVSPIREMFAALDLFKESTIVFTYPNADTHGGLIIQAIEGYVACHANNTCAVASLGQRKYLSLMREADVIIGNSSSALIEAPALHKATVNIGDRQKGRLKAASVIDAPENADAIKQAIDRSLSPSFTKTLPDVISLYGHGGVSLQIKTVLKGVLLPAGKSFHALKTGE